jgi:hypothetical protein
MKNQGKYFYLDTGDYYVGGLNLTKNKEGELIIELGNNRIFMKEDLKLKKNGRGTFWWVDGSWYE